MHPVRLLFYRLEGPNGLLEYMRRVLSVQGHVVVCVAEGAGKDVMISHTDPDQGTIWFKGRKLWQIAKTSYI